MRRLVAWIGGTVGGITAYRLMRRRPVLAPEPGPEPSERAEELRAKLAESRAAEPEVEPMVEEPQQPDSPEERRRRVHDEGRSALDEMKGE